MARMLALALGIANLQTPQPGFDFAIPHQFASNNGRVLASGRLIGQFSAIAVEDDP
jgi:hypothetical protein